MRPSDCDRLLEKQAKSYRLIITGLLALVSGILTLKATFG